MPDASVFAALAPALLVLVGVIPEVALPIGPYRRLAVAAAGTAFALALASALGVAVNGAGGWTLLQWSGLGLSIHLDVLSATMFALVAFVGLVVVAFSRNYLDGNPGQGRFIRGLCLTLGAVMALILSGNLAGLFVAWVATNAALQRLLLFYPHRQPAVLAARKKFVVNRLAELCLLGACVLLYREVGSLELGAIFEAAPGLNTASLQAIALLLASAALIQTAQLPLHGWLLEVMETPTPVSALLHAGVINAGGFLVLRLSPVIVEAQAAMTLLMVVGATTAILGSLIMMTQTSVKVSLAWSTIAQMGFMMLECGLGAFAAALLHLVAHSLYKAHAFLSSGGVVDLAKVGLATRQTPAPPGRLALALVLLLAITLGLALILGAGPTQKPGAFVLGAVLLLGLGQLVASGIRSPFDMRAFAPVALSAAAVGLAYMVLQAGAEQLTAAVLPHGAGLTGPIGGTVSVLVVLAFASLSLLQSLIYCRPDHPAWSAAYAHISNGFYLNTLANRWALRLWPNPPAPSPEAATPGAVQ